MADKSFFQEIYDIVCEIEPDNNTGLIIYLEYGEISYSFAIYAKINGEYVKCYDWEKLSDDVLRKTFADIDKIVVEERKKITGEKWTNLTLVIDGSGSFTADYDYTDLSTQSYEYKKKWKAKYLA